MQQFPFTALLLAPVEKSFSKVKIIKSYPFSFIAEGAGLEMISTENNIGEALDETDLMEEFSSKTGVSNSQPAGQMCWPRSPPF